MNETNTNDWRAELSAKQARVIAIAEDRGFRFDAPISDIQISAPTINDLRKSIYPDFVASLDSFLATFDVP